MLIRRKVQHMVARILGLDKPRSPLMLLTRIGDCNLPWRGLRLLGAQGDSTVAVSQSGKLSARGRLTPAQQMAEAQEAQRRTGAVDYIVAVARHHICSVPSEHY